MNRQEIVCIVCPNSCVMQVDSSSDALSVTGNKCKRGTEFAENEIKNPVRMLCTTVRTSLPGCPVLPVRLSAEIPKGRIFEAMASINAVTVNDPVRCGDVVLADLLGLGIDVLASADCTFCPNSL